MSPEPNAPDTIVLIHGFWVTPRSWEDWAARYEAAGYKVLTPAYPGFEVEVEALRADPTPIVDLRVPAIVEHLEAVIGALDAPPILMGHSAGGAFMQLVMDHGFGACGVAVNSAPTEGVPVAPWSQIKATWPILHNPANHDRAVGFTLEQWTYAFTNGLGPEKSKALYDRYHVPASGRILFDSVTANLLPGHQGTWVDYHNDERAPLLFLSGSEDHLMPPAIQASNAKHYKSDKTLTEVRTFDGPHLMPAQDGWEEIADYALDWAVAHATTRAAA
jgi:pimeloyl-ACP methyl ester carboxylesterase